MNDLVGDTPTDHGRLVAVIRGHVFSSSNVLKLRGFRILYVDGIFLHTKLEFLFAISFARLFVNGNFLSTRLCCRLV